MVESEADGPFHDVMNDVGVYFPCPSKSAEGDTRGARGGILGGGFKVVFDFLEGDIFEGARPRIVADVKEGGVHLRGGKKDWKRAAALSSGEMAMLPSWDRIGGTE